MPTCPYHGRPTPCITCSHLGMGAFNLRPRTTRTCPIHGGLEPCRTCEATNRGSYAHATAPSPPTVGGRRPYVAPGARPRLEPMRQITRNDCAVAACWMVINALSNTRPRYTEIKSFMAEVGIRPEGEMAYAGNLCRVFDEWELNSQVERVEITQLCRFLQGGALCVIEISDHVIVILNVNLHTRQITICDPAIAVIEVVGLGDSRLRRYTRTCYIVWR